jgi:hypothetical protein
MMKPTMKTMVELLYELIPMGPFDFAERVGLADLRAAYGQRLDFENWLRRCLKPGQRFAGIEEAYGQYIKSFG